MKDNQNRNLEATKRHQALQKLHHDTGMEALDARVATMAFAEWAEAGGVSVLRLGNSKFVAQPITGRKSSRKFDIIDLDTMTFVCQVNKNEVHKWLQRAGE